MTYDYLTWDKTVQTLSSVISVASRPSHCADPSCVGHSMHLLSAEGQPIAPKGFGYGYDVVTRIGWLRQDRRDIYADIHASLPSHVQISLSHVRYLYQDVYLPLLACQERQYKDQLALQRDFSEVDPLIVILSLSKDDYLAKIAPFDRLRMLAASKSRCSTSGGSQKFLG